jgi:hypothetical protein
LPTTSRSTPYNIARAIAGKRNEQRFSGKGESFIEAGDSCIFGNGDFYADSASPI